MREPRRFEDAFEACSCHDLLVAGPDYTPIRFDRSGTDLDEAAALFTAGYTGSGFHITPTAKPFFYRHTIVGTSQITLRRTTFHAHIEGVVPPGPDYIITWLIDGRGHWDTGDNRYDLRLNEPVVFPTDRDFHFDFTDVEQRLVHIDRATLDQIAVEHTGTPPGALHLDHRRTPDPKAVQAWRNTLALVSRTLPDLDGSPLLQNEMVRIAGIALLGMFPPQPATLPEVLLRPGNTRLKIAVEYIHANAHLPINTTMIAQAAGLSVRSLQEGFRRAFDLTPTTYLRNVRLDRVREDLRRQPPGTIAHTAKRWGFTHLGRFATEYRTRHGETPTTTETH